MHKAALTFIMDVVCICTPVDLLSTEENIYLIVINGECLPTFHNRIPFKDVTHLKINGKVIIHSITLARAKDYDNWLQAITKDFTLLHVAAQNGDLPDINRLLIKGADVNARDFENATPLLRAVENDHFEVASRLLKVQGVDVHAKDSTRFSTALHVASQKGHIEMVKLLLQHGAYLNVKKCENFTPLHLAIQHKHVNVAVYLIKKGADVNVVDELQWTPLHNAVYNGCSFKLIKDLVRKGSSVNARENDGRTPLHFVAEFNFHEIAAFLIKKGSEIEAVDNRLWTPLHYAAYDGNIEVARLLLEKGANVEVKTIKCTTPLHFAVDHNHINMVKLLLQKGASVNAMDDTNWTPLHFAKDKGYRNIADLLLKHGAEKLSLPEDNSAMHLDYLLIRSFQD